jgi:putative nucleotidyltransferase with HDIG domain
MCRLSQQAIDHILSRGRIFEVGGAVRDSILYGPDSVHERDYLVTGIPYDELTGILRKFGKVNLVGRSFGVVKFTQFDAGEPQTFDITLPRREHSTGVGHRDFEVAFDPNLNVEDDLMRRDFTVNAMAVALDSHQLIDPLDGREDLEMGRIRMVYDRSFEDDPLRMMRAVQFAARFEFVVETETFQAMRQQARLINTVSSERIAEELNKLLTLAQRPSVGLRLMHESGLLNEIIPELQECMGVAQPGGFHKYDVLEHTLYTVDACPQRLRLRLAALFHDINKPQHRRLVENGATFYGHERSGAETAAGVMRRLRYSNDLIDEVAALVERHMFTTDVTDKGLRRLLRRVGPELVFDLLDLRRADVAAQGVGGTAEDVDEFEQRIREELSRKPPLTVSDLALDGHDIMAMLNLEPGPTVGRIMNHLLECVIDSPENNSRDKLTSLAEEFYTKDKTSKHNQNANAGGEKPVASSMPRMPRRPGFWLKPSSEWTSKG